MLVKVGQVRMKNLKHCLILAMGLALLLSDVWASELIVEKGKTVVLDYTLKIEDEIIESSAGKKPIEYIQGENILIPGLEAQLAGLHVGEEAIIKVPAREAYGEIDLSAYQEINSELLPQGTEQKIGRVVKFKTKAGDIVQATISEVKGTSVILNFNHPLAGKDLVFIVRILNVK